MASLTATYTVPNAPSQTGYLGASFLAEAVTSGRSSSQFRVSFSDETVSLVVRGIGFSFDGNGLPNRGTILSVSVSDNNSPLYDVVGLQLNATVLYRWVLSYNENPAPSPIFSSDDTFIGGPTRDFFDGDSGHDVMMGGEGRDQLIGGEGNDHIYGQSPNGGLDGDDNLNGQAGSDYIQGNAGNDNIGGGEGSDRIYGGAGDDRISGDDGRESLAGNDTINGNLGDDSIEGGSGNDLLRGGQGQDRLDGGRGGDTLLGDRGNDVLIGGAGADVMTGGEGRDGFYLRANSTSSVSGLNAEISAQFTKSGPDAYIVDTITDFKLGEDFLGMGTAYLTTAFYNQQAAADIIEAVEVAEQILRENNANITTQPGVALVAVGADTYLFMRSYSDEINLGVRLLNMAPEQLAATPAAFGFSTGYI